MTLLDVGAVSWCAQDVGVLDRVSLSATAGEFIAILGKNGAGKSTLLDVIAGLKRPTGGTIRIDGQSIEASTARARARHVAHLPQLLREALPFSAEQVVTMGRYPHADRWFESDADRRAVDVAMDRCQCAEWRHRQLSTLSGGERQRVLLAACLAQEAKVLLLDEPSTFLDVDLQLHCFSILRDEAARGCLCIAVTHDVNLALAFCSRVIVMGEGTIAYDRSAAHAARDTSWLALLSPRLSLDPTVSGGSWVTYR